MKIEISIGEIVDKLSILQIKTGMIKEEKKVINVKKEYDYLYNIVFNEMKIEQTDFFDMVIINTELWKIEDDIRKKESQKEFDQEFINLARLVYITNDKRADIKKKINRSQKNLFAKLYTNFFLL